MVLWSFLTLGALGELWLETNLLYPLLGFLSKSLDLHVAILHYQANIEAQFGTVCRIGSQMLVAILCLKGFSTHFSTP